MMITRILLPLLCLTTATLSFAQSEVGYSIEGKMEGLEEGEKVTMMLYDVPWGRGVTRSDGFVPRDSAYVKDGKFFIKGIVPDGPRIYRMVFNKHTFFSRIVDLCIDNGEKITIQSPDIIKINHEWIRHYVDLKGSPTNYAMLMVEYMGDLYFQNVLAAKNYIGHQRDTLGFYGPLLDPAFALLHQINVSYYGQLYFGGPERDPEIRKIDIVLPTGKGDFMVSGHASYWIDFYNQLDEQKKNSFHGRWLKDLIKLCVGQKLPEFTLPTAEGKPLSLSEITSKNKMTIVQLWASSSQNRQQYQDELRAFYKKYHVKGLEIVGMSTDKFLNEWQDMMHTENYPWYNVIDLGGKITSDTYYEYTGYRNEQTKNVLLDKDGKIVAWDVNGSELQWYLWKALGE